jgi:hypothetical protein
MSFLTVFMVVGLPLARQTMDHGKATFPVASDGSDRSLSLCPHCEMLGVSAAIRPDRESADILHCVLCRITFQFTTEGTKLNVTHIVPYAGEA